MSDQQPPASPPYKRRPRYKGTHPKKFSEKYKEQSDEATKAKIMAKGGTPAGTHRPIMVDEIMEHLQLKPGSIVVDCTLGYGGHSSEILKRISPGGTLIAFDRDPIESKKTEERLRALIQGRPAKSLANMSSTKPDTSTNPDASTTPAPATSDAAESAAATPPLDAELIIVHANYAELNQELKKRNFLGRVDALLADLGLSSMQIDDPSRGFTYKHEGPLDLRMNPEQGEPAHQLLKKLSEEELQAILEENADEPRAKWVAKALKAKPIETTTELANAMKAWLKTLSAKTRESEGDTPIRRAMQALRIEVNQEFTSLDRLLEQLTQATKPNARIAILTFHSGEDRRVKKAFQALERANEMRDSSEALRPSFDEQRSNTRSKSAKLRLTSRR